MGKNRFLIIILFQAVASKSLVQTHILKNFIKKIINILISKVGSRSVRSKTEEQQRASLPGSGSQAYFPAQEDQGHESLEAN